MTETNMTEIEKKQNFEMPNFNNIMAFKIDKDNAGKYLAMVTKFSEVKFSHENSTMRNKLLSELSIYMSRWARKLSEPEQIAWLRECEDRPIDLIFGIMRNYRPIVAPSLSAFTIELNSYRIDLTAKYKHARELVYGNRESVIINDAKEFKILEKLKDWNFQYENILEYKQEIMKKLYGKTAIEFLSEGVPLKQIPQPYRVSNHINPWLDKENINDFYDSRHGDLYINQIYDELKKSYVIEKIKISQLVNQIKGE